MNSSVLDSLDRKTKLSLLAKIINYEEIPVSIEQFIADDYYLGRATDNGKKVYKVWRKAFNEMYPDPIMLSSSFICLNGSTRTGKSNTSKIMIAYDIYKLLKLGKKNALDYFELTPRPFIIGIGHKTKQQAEANVKEVYELLEQSPFFMEQFNDPSSFIHDIQIIPVRNTDDVIGLNLYDMWISECNFFDVDKGTELINSVINRIEGTFRKGFGLFNHIILDSSDTDVDAVVPTFLKRNAYGREAVQYKFARYEVKPSWYYRTPDPDRIDKYEFLYDSLHNRIPNANFGKPALTFRVYCGDAEIHPCIITDDIRDSVLAQMDEDRFIDVPNELLPAFKNDLETSLQDVCGIALEMTNQYFNPKYVVPAFNLPNQVHLKGAIDSEDSICCLFGDENDTFQQYLEEAIELLPKDKNNFIAIDMALTSDKAGFCVGYIDSIGERNNDGIRLYDPIYKIPIAFSIGRYPGEETSIYKMVELIQWINERRPVYMVATDHFQSYAIEQACVTMEILHKFYVIEKQTYGWKLTKDALYRNKLFLTQNRILKNEMLNVYYDEAKQKVDHHEVVNAAGDIGSDSKDILDAIVRCVLSMNESLNSDFDEVMATKIKTTSDFIKKNQEYLKAWEDRQYRNNFSNKLRMQMMNRRH